MTIDRRAAGVVGWVPPIAAAAAAIALIAFSLQSYEPLKRYLDTFTGDGNAEAFTRDLFASLVRSSRLAAAALIGLAGVLMLVRRRIERALASLRSNTFGYAAAMVRAGIDTLRGETAWHRAALFSLVALGVVLRVRTLEQPINYDEAFTYDQYASRPFFVGLTNYSYPNNHLLHTLLVHASIRLFGSALWAIRIPAFVAGCAAIPLAYAVARRLTGRREGLIVAALMAVSHAMITYSVVARGYSILVVFFLIALCCALDIVVTRARAPWTLLTCVCAAGFFTIPVFVYPYGGVMLWLLWAGFRDPQNAALRAAPIARSAVGTVALAAACYAPAAATTGLQSGLDYALPTLTSGYVGSLPALIRAGTDVLRGLPVAVLLVMLACTVFAIRQRWRTAAGVMPVAIAMFPAIVVPLQGKLAPARAWVYLLPVFFVYAAAGIVAVADWLVSLAPRTAPPAVTRAVAPIVAIAIAAQALTHLPPRYPEWTSRSGVYADDDLVEVAEYLKTALRPQDAFVAWYAETFTLEYYFRSHGVPLAPLKNPPHDATRLIILANPTRRYPVERVLGQNAASFRYTAQPTLLRTFTYAWVYEVALSPR